MECDALNLHKDGAIGRTVLANYASGKDQGSIWGADPYGSVNTC